MSSEFNQRFSATPAASSQRTSSWLALGAMGLFMLTGTLILVWMGTPQESPADGQPILRLELKPLLNTDRQLDESSLQGQITVMHFWGTWCEPCRQEMPEFVSVSKRLRELPGVQLVSVSCSRSIESDLAALKTQTEDYLKSFDADMEVFCDPAALSRSQIGMLMPNAAFIYPCTIITDSSGLVAGVWQGHTDLGMQQVLTRVEQLLDRSAKSSKPQQLAE